jgi:hypothetical protein
MSDSDWNTRIEEKLDRVAELLAGHVAEDRAVAADVQELKHVTGGLKETQDKQRGAISFITVLSLAATVVLAIIEGARYLK